MRDTTGSISGQGFPSTSLPAMMQADAAASHKITLKQFACCQSLSGGAVYLPVLFKQLQCVIGCVELWYNLNNVGQAQNKWERMDNFSCFSFLSKTYGTQMK